jgi:hypothetical protein
VYPKPPLAFRRWLAQTGEKGPLDLPVQRAKLEKFVGKEIDVTWDYDALVPDSGVL